MALELTARSDERDISMKDLTHQSFSKGEVLPHPVPTGQAFPDAAALQRQTSGGHDAENI